VAERGRDGLAAGIFPRPPALAAPTVAAFPLAVFGNTTDAEPPEPVV
jgi:hypothetical protein